MTGGQIVHAFDMNRNQRVAISNLITQSKTGHMFWSVVNSSGDAYCIPMSEENTLIDWQVEPIPCNHQNTAIEVTGGFSRDCGEWGENFSEHLVCVDCGANLDAIPVSVDLLIDEYIPF